MRQVCNIAFVAQAESFSDDDDLARWLHELPLEPGVPGVFRPQSRPVDPALLELMGPGR